MSRNILFKLRSFFKHRSRPEARSRQPKSGSAASGVTTSGTPASDNRAPAAAAPDTSASGSTGSDAPASGAESAPAPDPAFDLQAGYQNVEEQMRLVLWQQRELQLTVEQLRTSTAALGETVRMTNMQGGLEKLCDLWSVVNRTSGELNEYYADLLAEALKLFGAEPVSPAAGDRYDSQLHMKDIFSSQSDEIACCEKCNWGWIFRGDVLRKAVVSMKEETMKEETKEVQQ